MPGKAPLAGILKARWNLFGHILRRDSDIPANKATRAYFIQYGHKLRGRPTTTLPILLNRDLELIDHFRLQLTDCQVKKHRTCKRQGTVEKTLCEDRESCSWWKRIAEWQHREKKEQRGQIRSSQREWCK